jgi:hypothetical protein
VFLDQQKRICMAVSVDGLNWTKQGDVLRRDPEHDYENIAVAGPVVRQLPSGLYQMWYSAIGTRWGYYCICYAESIDGLNWNRGSHYGDNLQLGPKGSGWASNDWENKMVEYPSVVTREDGSYRLFYTGNGYGEGGIGTAVSTPVRVTRDERGAHLIVAGGDEWKLSFPSIAANQPICWHGPDAEGTIWFELSLQDGIPCRVALVHTEVGVMCRITVMNETGKFVREISVDLTLEPLGVNRNVISWEQSHNRALPNLLFDAQVLTEGRMQATITFLNISKGKTMTAISSLVPSAKA